LPTAGWRREEARQIYATELVHRGIIYAEC